MSEEHGDLKKHHHSHHEHSHGDLSVSDKLRKLLVHWQHHNEDHARSFEDWEKKAREQGLGEVADSLAEAADLTRRINHKLAKALKSMEDV